MTRCRRGLGTDSNSMHLEDPQTPDIVRSRSNQDTLGGYQPMRKLDLQHYDLDSPTVSINALIFCYRCKHELT